MKELVDRIGRIDTFSKIEIANTAIRARYHELQRAETMKFKKGDKVGWTKQHVAYTGIVKSLNISSLIIIEDKTDKLWSIGSSCLKLIN